MLSFKKPEPTQSFPSWVFLLCSIALIAIARFHTFDEPAERDLSVYAVIGHEMLQGKTLYSNLWDHKPPAIHLTFALTELITGYGPQEFFFLGLMTAVLTLLGIYKVGSAIGGWKGGAWAAVFWTVVCSDMLLEANQPNTESFDNLALVWALAFLLSFSTGAKNTFLCGVMLAVASLYKPQAVGYVFLFTVVLFFCQPKERRFRNTFRALLLLAIPTALAWGGCWLYFTLTHRWQDFYGAVILYNRDYANDQVANLIMGLKPGFFYRPYVRFLTLPCTLIVLAFLKDFKIHSKIWLLFAAYAVGTYYFVSSAGHFHPHYYQLWLPVVSIGAAWASISLGENLSLKGRRLSWMPAVVCLSALLYHEIPNYALTAEQWSLQKYGGTFLECRELGSLLGKLLKPGESFSEFGNDPGLYFYSRKSEPTGIIYIHPAMNGPIAGILWDRYQKDMASHPAEIMVVDNLAFPNYYKSFLDKFGLWRFFPMNGHYALMVAKGGELEKRLKKNGSFFQENTVGKK